MRKFDHIGIPTTVKQDNEMYSADMRLFLTDYSKSPNRIEYLRFESESTMPQILKDVAHIAYVVDCLECEMKDKKVVMPITPLSEELTIAFIEEEGIAIELMQYTKK